MNECDLPDEDEMSDEEAIQAAEAAWDMFEQLRNGRPGVSGDQLRAWVGRTDRLDGGDAPVTLTEQQLAAWRLK